MKIVTGCMRSGTSFVCSLLERLGGNLGQVENHVPADKWNANGYYETRKINYINNALMFGKWGPPELWVDQMWPDDWRVRFKKNLTLAAGPWATRPSAIAKRAALHSDEIMALSEEFEEVIIKDPRFSYVMAPWMAHGQIDSVLYCVRHPWEAAYSMKRQTGLPVFLTYMGWEDAIERFWSIPLDRPVTIVNYNGFFNPETALEEVKRLYAFLEKDFDETEARLAIGEVYNPKMRSGVAENIGLPKKTQRLYQNLLERHAAQKT